MDKEQLREFYQILPGTDPLRHPEQDAKYVPILQKRPMHDPILLLFTRIDLAVSESVNLLTGFRGNGKTTELYRLQDMLEAGGCHVVRLDMDDYLNAMQPVEISDFLLSVAAALSESLAAQSSLQPLREGFWDRLGHFLDTDVRLEQLDLDFKAAGAGAKLGFKLKQDPSFKQQVQQRLRGHVAGLVQQTHDFVTNVVQSLREQTGKKDLKVVIIVDSVEHLRGVGTDARAVHESVINTFSAHGDKLALPQAHMLYTVPPFLLLHANGATRTLGGNPMVMWPNIHVLDKQGRVDPEGLRIMRAIIEHRFPAWADFIPPEQLETLTATTGGDLRDFFRQVREVLARLSVGLQQGIAVEEHLVEMVEAVTAELRNSLRMMLTEQDRARMGRIHKDKDLRPDGPEEIPAFTALLDSNLVMNYQNGAPWFDIHPLLREDDQPSVTASVA